MNRRCAPLERLAKLGLLLVVNGAPPTCTSGLSGARKPPLVVVDVAIESK